MLCRKARPLKYKTNFVFWLPRNRKFRCSHSTQYELLVETKPQTGMNLSANSYQLNRRKKHFFRLSSCQAILAHFPFAHFFTRGKTFEFLWQRSMLARRVKPCALRFNKKNLAIAQNYPKNNFLFHENGLRERGMKIFSRGKNKQIRQRSLKAKREFELLRAKIRFRVRRVKPIRKYTLRVAKKSNFQEIVNKMKKNNFHRPFSAAKAKNFAWS